MTPHLLVCTLRLATQPDAKHSGRANKCWSLSERKRGETRERGERKRGKEKEGDTERGRDR